MAAKKDPAEILRSDIADIAVKFGRAKVTTPEHIEKLRKIGFRDDQLTNNALVVASIFANAVNGDINAVNKWQELTGVVVLPEAQSKDEIEDILNGRRDNGKSGAVRKNRSAISDD